MSEFDEAFVPDPEDIALTYAEHTVTVLMRGGYADYIQGLRHPTWDGSHWWMRAVTEVEIREEHCEEALDPEWGHAQEDDKWFTSLYRDDVIGYWVIRGEREGSPTFHRYRDREAADEGFAHTKSYVIANDGTQ